METASAYSLKVPTQASRIEAYTGVNPDELTEQITQAHRVLLVAEKNLNLSRQLQEIKKHELIERRRAELEKGNRKYTEAALKSYALAHDEYRAAVLAVDESDAERIGFEVEHKALKTRMNVLLKEASLARDEAFYTRQKQ